MCAIEIPSEPPDVVSTFHWPLLTKRFLFQCCMDYETPSHFKGVWKLYSHVHHKSLLWGNFKSVFTWRSLPIVIRSWEAEGCIRCLKHSPPQCTVSSSRLQVLGHAHILIVLQFYVLHFVFKFFGLLMFT